MTRKNFDKLLLPPLTGCNIGRHGVLSGRVSRAEVIWTSYLDHLKGEVPKTAVLRNGLTQRYTKWRKFFSFAYISLGRNGIFGTVAFLGNCGRRKRPNPKTMSRRPRWAKTAVLERVVYQPLERVYLRVGPADLTKPLIGRCSGRNSFPPFGPPG